MRLTLLLGVAAILAAQTPVLRKGVSVQMAMTANAVAMADADAADSVVVAVTSGGAVYLEVTKMTPAELAEKVKAPLAAHPGKRVYLKSDARTPYSTVSEVLDALRAAGVNAPILLTSQSDPRDSSTYVLPKGLEVQVSPAAQAATLKVGTADSELKQRAQGGRPVVLEAAGTTAFGDVVHAADVCRGAGARVYLAAAK